MTNNNSNPEIKKFSSSSLISEVDDSYSSVRKKNFDMEWRVDIVDKVN